MSQKDNQAKRIKYDVTLTLSGPGGIINGDAKMIAEILLKAGYRVNVKNECEDTDSRLRMIWTDGKNNLSKEEFDKKKKEMEDGYRRDIEFTRINFVVDHQPWGG